MGKVERLLIIGNGFDVAHGLPTQYMDFLKFSSVFRSCYGRYRQNGVLYSDEEFELYDSLCMSESIHVILHDLFVNGEYSFPSGDVIRVVDDLAGRLYYLIEDNLWIAYFQFLYKEKLAKGTKWIDFEAEISNVIQWIDSFQFRLESSRNFVLDTLHNDAKKDGNKKKEMVYGLIRDICISLNYEDLIDDIYKQLENLIESLNMYFCDFIEKIKTEKIDIIEKITPSYVISFNYTHTYETTYGTNAPVCYIHGECGTSAEPNMVLGIDEYLSEMDKNEKTNMSIFKKFVQRIRNHNDITYLKWYERWKEDNKELMEADKLLSRNSTARPPSVEVYIYGHSLGTTDKDILKLFLEPEYIQSTIYAYKKINEGKLIANLIRIIGEESLINKANGLIPRIRFKICE